MKDEVILIGNVFYGEFHHGFAGNVIGTDGVCFTITSMAGGYREPLIPTAYES